MSVRRKKRRRRFDSASTPLPPFPPISQTIVNKGGGRRRKTVEKKKTITATSIAQTYGSLFGSAGSIEGAGGTGGFPIPFLEKWMIVWRTLFSSRCLDWNVGSGERFPDGYASGTRSLYSLNRRGLFPTSIRERKKKNTDQNLPGWRTGERKSARARKGYGLKEKRLLEKEGEGSGERRCKSVPRPNPLPPPLFSSPFCLCYPLSRPPIGKVGKKQGGKYKNHQSMICHFAGPFIQFAGK